MLITINIISSVLLSIGAAMQKRVLLLPWLILNSALNIFYAIVTIAIFVLSIIIMIIISIVKEEFRGYQISDVMFWAPLVAGLSLLIMMIAFVHWLLLKVVNDHLRELREEVQGGQYHTIVYPNGVVNVFKQQFVPASTVLKAFWFFINFSWKWVADACTTLRCRKFLQSTAFVPNYVIVNMPYNEYLLKIVNFYSIAIVRILYTFT